MNTYTVANTQRWGLREFVDCRHPDYEDNILLTRVVKGGIFQITPRNAKEEEKLLNWPVGEDFIVDNWDYDIVEEFDDSELDAISEMDDDMLEAIEEETNYFWDLYNGVVDYDSADDSKWQWKCKEGEMVILDGEIEITAPEGWEIV